MKFFLELVNSLSVINHVILILLSIRFFRTDFVASFHHCLRVVKPAADDDGVLKNVMESGHRRFFEIRHGTRRSKLRDQRRYFLEDFDIQGLCLA